MTAPIRSLLVLPLLLAACRSMPDQRAVESPFSAAFEAPQAITTARMRLEPLQPKFNQLDYDAAQSSSEHLRMTLQWGQWPSADMTIDQNRGDLERHWKEFIEHEAYTYTVLEPSGKACLGCVYLYPLSGSPRTLQMTYWVTVDQLDEELDVHLVDTMLDMFEATWPVDQVVLDLPVQNPRGMKILEQRRLDRLDGNDGRVVFAWTR